jgi:hypothetical protein
MRSCDLCGSTLIVDDCLRCHAPQCCSVCCYNEQLAHDLGMMIRRLTHALKISLEHDHPQRKLIEQANQLLRNYDLQGSPLRDEYTEAERCEQAGIPRERRP